jgi:hypothetical protein
MEVILANQSFTPPRTPRPAYFLEDIKRFTPYFCRACCRVATVDK